MNSCLSFKGDCEAACRSTNSTSGVMWDVDNVDGIVKLRRRLAE
jgi:hypothetical protein